MKTIRVKSLGEFRAKLKASLKRKEKALDGARETAAKLHAACVRKNMPVAFGELRASVHAVLYKVVVDAPHAAAVERGSRPHWVPIEALLKWVQLRGFQGLASDKALSRLPGSSTAGAARSVAAGIRSISDSSGYSDTSGGASDAGAGMAIARAIQIKISRVGTKPTWFMRNSIPAARGFLSTEVHKALEKG